MRIGDINAAQTELRNVSVIEPHESVGETFQTFKRQLTSEAEEIYRQQMTDLINKINAQGKNISEKADIVSNGYAFNKQGSLDYRGRQRVFTTIRVVNDKLDALVSDFINGQADQIGVMGRIDEIRGLLVDMSL